VGRDAVPAGVARNHTPGRPPGNPSGLIGSRWVRRPLNAKAGTPRGAPQGAGREPRKLTPKPASQPGCPASATGRVRGLNPEPPAPCRRAIPSFSREGKETELRANPRARSTTGASEAVTFGQLNRWARTPSALILRSGRSPRLEGWGGHMLRDALLCNAPQHEAGRGIKTTTGKTTNAIFPKRSQSGNNRYLNGHPDDTHSPRDAAIARLFRASAPTPGRP
jgi:hypothetical protein